MPDILVLLSSSQPFFLVAVTLLGLIVGSFLNVVIYRIPVMMQREASLFCQTEHNAPKNPELLTPDTFNLIKPDSTCPKCQHKIRAWENIPVISWLWLRGRCSNCQTPISIRYPAIEALTGGMSFFVAWHFGFGWPCLAALFFTWILIALTFIDFDEMLLPDDLTLSLMWLGLLVSLGSFFVTPSEAIIGAAAGYLSLWSVYWLFKLTTGKEGFGYGDFKLLAALGAWLGWGQLPVIIMLSTLIGAVVGIAVLVGKGQNKIPFGPYLAIAGWVALFYGDWIVAEYWRYVLSQ